MTTLNLLKQKKAFLGASLFLTAFSMSAQTDNSLATGNTFIEGVTVESFFHQEPDTSSDTTKTTFAVNMTDGDDETDWAGQITQVAEGEAFNILSLNGDYDLAEVQLLTVTGKTAPYTFDILVSTTGMADADFTDVFTAAEKGTTGFLESHYLETPESTLDGTYKSFTLPTTIVGAKYIKVMCYGRTDVGNGGGSPWSTISELKFYQEGATASINDVFLANASIYPNPAVNSVSLVNLHEDVSQVEVLNLQGAVVLSQKVTNPSLVTLNTSGYSSGLYLIKVSNISGTISSSTKLTLE